MLLWKSVVAILCTCATVIHPIHVRGQCSFWYIGQPPQALDCNPLNMQLRLGCSAYVPLYTCETSTELKWYWTKNRMEIGLNGTEIKEPGIYKDVRHFPYSESQFYYWISSFYVTKNITQEDTGYYWCRIEASGSLSPFPTQILNLTVSTDAAIPKCNSQRVYIDKFWSCADRRLNQVLPTTAIPTLATDINLPDVIPVSTDLARNELQPSVAKNGPITPSPVLSNLVTPHPTLAESIPSSLVNFSRAMGDIKMDCACSNFKGPLVALIVAFVITLIAAGILIILLFILTRKHHKPKREKPRVNTSTYEMDEIPHEAKSPDCEDTAAQHAYENTKMEDNHAYEKPFLETYKDPVYYKEPHLHPYKKPNSHHYKKPSIQLHQRSDESGTGPRAYASLDLTKRDPDSYYTELSLRPGSDSTIQESGNEDSEEQLNISATE